MCSDVNGMISIRKCIAHTHTAVLQPFVRDYPGGLVPEETFTHLT